MPPKQTFDYLFNNSNHFKTLVEANRSRITNYCANNEYMLKIRGESIYKQLKRIAEQTEGFYILQSTYSRLRHGQKAVCSDLIYTILAAYHGLTVSELENLDRSKYPMPG